MNLNLILQDYNVPTLSEDLKYTFEGLLSYSDLLFCLKKTLNNTSPGFDGFINEFFKFFWNDLGYVLLRAINCGFEKGELSESQKQGVITCVPKGNKDKQYLKKTGVLFHYPILHIN